MSIYTKAALGTFLTEIAKGNIAGHYPYRKWGKNPDIDTAAAEMIYFTGGIYNWTTLGETVALVSTLAADASGGTGWRKCQVTGLDENYNVQSEIVTLTGVAPKNTQLSYIWISRVNCNAEGTEVGSGEVNAGTITGTGNTSSKIFFTIEPGKGTTQILMDIVPAGKTLYLTNFILTSTKAGGGTVPILVSSLYKQQLNLGKTMIQEDIIDVSINNQFVNNPSLPFKIEEKTRYWFEVSTDQNNTIISGEINGFLADN